MKFSQACAALIASLLATLASAQAPAEDPKVMPAAVSSAQAKAQARVLGLVEAYRLAEHNDSAWAAARQRHRAAVEAYPIARSALLPSLSASAGYARVHRDIDLGASVREQRYNNDQYRLQLRQSILDLDRITRVRMSLRDVDVADIELELARQNLISRLVEAYFAVLLAQERVSLSAAQIEAITAQKEQAERLQAGGVATQTDVLEAQALLDRTRAEEIAARNQLEIARRRLVMIIGGAEPVVQPLAEDVEFAAPQPASLTDWVDRATLDALEVRARSLMLERSGLDVTRARSQHLPTLDAYASANRSSDTDDGYDRDTIGRIGVELNIPLYAGGRVNAEVRQAAARRDQARDEVELARSESALAASTAYSDLTNSLARIHALEQAVRSAETALHAAEMSFGVAYRTFVDVLNAQQLLYRSRFDLLGARFDYVRAVVALNAAVGALDETVINTIDAWQATAHVHETE